MRRLIPLALSLMLLVACASPQPEQTPAAPVVTTERPDRDISVYTGVVKGGGFTLNGRPLGFARLEDNGGSVVMSAHALKRLINNGDVLYIGELPGVYPVAQSDALAGRTIFIDAGHGVGADGGTSGGGIMEHELVLTYAKLLRANLENLGATVFLTREGEEDVPHYRRMAYVNGYCLNELIKLTARGEREYDMAELNRLKAAMDEVEADPEQAYKYFGTPYDDTQTTPLSPTLRRIFELQRDVLFEDYAFISIHCNGPGNYGTYTYAMNNEINAAYYDRYNEKDINALIERLQAGVVRGGGFVSRGIRYNDFFMVRETGLTAALLELAYMHDQSDLKKLTDGDVQKSIVNGITAAVVDYFEYVDERFPV